MPAEKSQTGRRTLQPACDACHIRRVKCSHEQPCAHCSRLGLTCTYTKAHTAKVSNRNTNSENFIEIDIDGFFPFHHQKTAGKRIEALRQAEKSRQIYADKRNEVWGAPQAEAQSGNRAWNNNPPHTVESGYGHAPSAPFATDPRYNYSPTQYQGEERKSHQFYTNSHPSNPSPSEMSPGSHNMNNAMGNSSGWGPSSSTSSSTRSRQSHPYDNERQVRFQPNAAPNSSDRSHFGSVSSASGNNHGIHSMSYNQHSAYPNSSSQITQMSASVPPIQYRDGPSNDVPFLPSSSHYFTNPSNHRSSFEEQGQQPNLVGSGSGGMQTLDASTNTVNMTFEDQIPTIDLLQTSVLPPFSTSMTDSLFNNENVFNADSIFDEASLPPLLNAGNGQQTMLDMLGACLPSGETPGSVDSASIGTMENMQNPIKNGDGTAAKDQYGRIISESTLEIHPLSDSALIPTLALFYERLGGVMPVFSRTWLFSRLDKDDHQTDPHFAAMLIAMSALVVIQAQPHADAKDKRADRLSARKRRSKATRLLEETLKLREGPMLGQHSNLEMCCTSFFVFATLFGLGEHSAAWYRLRESITLAHLCRLHEPASYENLPRDEAERRLRMYWLLAITERAFAIQRGMPLMLTGNPRASTASLRAKLGFKELSDFPDLQLRLFDHVDEKFVDCWNRKCQGPGCPNFDAERAIALWKSFTEGINQPGSRERSATGEDRDEDGGVTGHEHSSGASNPYRSSTMSATPVQRRQVQRADVEVTRHWLLNRLWLITLNHGLLSIDARDPPLRVDHALHVAQSVYDVCDGLSLAAMEAHGVGFTYKLFDVAQTLVLLCKDEMIAEAISKGGVGDQLEKQTTKAHTGGRGRASDRDRRPSETKSEQYSTAPSTASNNAFPLNLFGDVVDPSIVNVFRGPASLRRIVLGILNEYLTLFQKFRGGDHPYLEKLIELINECKQENDPFDTPSSIGTAMTNTGNGPGSFTNTSSIDGPHVASVAGTSSLDEPHANLTEGNNSVDTSATHMV